jgi:hypothetical protein
MLIRYDTKRDELFVKYDDGRSLEVSEWFEQGPYGYLKDGETVTFDDHCTATRRGEYVMVYDPDFKPKRRRRATHH